MRAGNWFQGGFPPAPTGSQAPVFLVSLHLLQVGAAALFHLLQCLAPASSRLPAWECFDQCPQLSRLLGHHLLQLCPKQQGLMGWGRPPGAQGGDGWTERTSETHRGGLLSVQAPPRGQPSPPPPHHPTPLSTSLVGRGGLGGVLGSQPGPRAEPHL